MSVLNPLYNAVAWVLAQIHAGLSVILGPFFGGSARAAGSGWTWALTIVVLVVLMRLILVPLFVKQMHATRKMAALAPQLQELRKKYKNDKETLNAETMRLYRENGANPLAGCLPLVAQMPMFFALFNVLRGISIWKGGPTPYGLPELTVVSAQHAWILGAHISDKVLFTGTQFVPLHAKIVIVGAVIISVATTFMTVRQSTKRGMTPTMTPSDSPLASSQKFMAYIVPLFALSGLYWQFGLVLYWVTTNVWTLGQQHLLFKRYPMPLVATPGGAPSGGVTPAGVSGPAAPAEKKAGKAPAAGNTSGGKPAKPASDSGAGKSRATAADSGGGTGGQAPANGAGMLRRLGRGRSEPEPQPAAPEVKLVRQQRVHQSRSKRSGKR